MSETNEASPATNGSDLERLVRCYRVYREGRHPKPKRHFYKETFSNRQKARNFCRNRAFEKGLVIVSPDGGEEEYT